MGRRASGLARSEPEPGGAARRATILRASDPWNAETMAREVRAGLQRRPLPEIPSKYFYDDRGSALFEEITRLPEYYQTRTEEAILQARAPDVVAAVRPRELVEIGSGAGRKIRLFLDAMRRAGRLERCVLLDINEGMLRDSLDVLEAEYPAARFHGVAGDFLHDLPALGPGGGRLLLFLAGTLGNLHPGGVPPFFRAAARILARGDGFLVGLDLVKDPVRLQAAYDDAAGVTAEFNRNVLRVLNRRLGADFDVDAFDHVAFYDQERRWIEMRLRARRPMRVRVPGCRLKLHFAAGAEIRTELSCKYTRDSLSALLEGTGLGLESWLTDERADFATALLRRW